MTVFDQAFKAAFAAPFQGTHQFKHPETATLYEVTGIFTADQVQDRVSGAPLKHNVYTLELDENYIQQLPIGINSIFIINEKHYRVTAKPFIDEIGWATLDITLTTA